MGKGQDGLRKAVMIFCAAVLAGCIRLPTLPASPTPTATSLAALPEVTATSSMVTITGNVWMRDAEGNAHGWLAAGQQVLAVCDGNWCVLSDNGLRFWRGCSANNPDKLACRMR